VRVLADKDLQMRLGAQGMVDAQQYAWPRVAARVLQEYEVAAGNARGAAWRREFR
jgi:hypothetical protein